MKKVLSYTLISFIIFANLFAPISVGLDGKSIEIKSSKAEAVERDGSKEAFTQNFSASILSRNNTTYVDETLATADLHLILDTGLPKNSNASDAWKYVATSGNIATCVLTLGGACKNFETPNTFILKFENLKTNKVGWLDATSFILTPPGKNYTEMRGESTMPTSIELDISIRKNINGDFTQLEPDTSYKTTLYYLACTASQCGSAEGNGESISGVTEEKSYFPAATLNPLTTANKIQQNIGALGSGEVKISEGSNAGDLPTCDVTSPSSWFSGCIAQALYYLFFKTSSFVFGLSGKALDFTLMYSISDTSYRSSFVVEGWGIVKDFCNMFFIFVLLYIAFGTILNLHNVKTKEMIINVVIIGLLINFSLFATQVIIDASNILTRVFYNQKTIVTGTAQKDASGNPLPTKSELGDFGEIKLSEAIVSKVNPQELIMRASEVESIPIRGTMTGEDQTKTKQGISTGTFIIVIFLATAVNIVGTIAFLSSAFVFIARVVGLWLAMILAPLAFFSYIVPQLQDIKMIGWKKWWPDTLKMAFVAPVFAFFMYIIVGFMDKGLGIIDASMKTGKGGLTFVIAIVVPFAFIMILLMKAKSIAVDMSGEVGAAISKVGAVAGGLALGVATGGAAIAGRATLGRLGSKMASSSKLAEIESKGGIKGFGAKMLLKGGAAAGSGSMDLRGVKIAGKGLSDTGLKSLGKPKEGGYKKAEEDKLAKRTKRAEDLKKIVNKDSEIKKRKANVDKKIIEDKYSKDIHDIDANLVRLRQQLSDEADPGERARISTEIRVENSKLSNIKSGGQIAGTNNYYTDTGAQNGKNIIGVTKEIKDIDHKIEHDSNQLAKEYATMLGSNLNKWANILSAGSTRKGTDEAVDNIRLGIVTKSVSSHGGGGSPAPAHPTPAAAAKPAGTAPASAGHAPTH